VGWIKPFLKNLMVSNKVVSLNNEASLEDFEKTIKSLDLKSRGFINKTHPNTIPFNYGGVGCV
jgi:hypothetical protein